MVIKYKCVPYVNFALLVEYLSFGEGNGNCLTVDDVECGSLCIPDEYCGEQRTLVFGDKTFSGGYAPFARLLTAEPSYNGNRNVEWTVEIEIPEFVHVGVIDTTGKLMRSTVGTLRSGYLVDSGRMLREINEVVLKGIIPSRVVETVASN